MKLIFFKPGYFSKYNDSDYITKFFNDISNFFENKEYSPIIDIIMIGPIIVPEELIDETHWNEVVKCWPKSHDASVSKHINYDVFLNSCMRERKILLINNILESVKELTKKGKIDYESFKKDMLEFCRINKIKIEKINNS